MKIEFAKYDMDSGYVFSRLIDGNVVLINCTAVERTYAENMYERSELYFLIYEDPASYVELVLDGDVRNYLKRITQYKPLDC